MMITELFYFDISKKNFCQKIIRSKNFKQKFRHQVVEAEALRVEAEAIQKLPLPHPRIKPITIFTNLYETKNCVKHYHTLSLIRKIRAKNL